MAEPRRLLPRTVADSRSRPVRRLAIICYHSSPLGLPGSRDTGGMNVYVRESARALAALGWAIDVFTRDDGSGPSLEIMSPGVRLVRIIAGPQAQVAKRRLPEYVRGFSQGVSEFRLREGIRYDLLQSHYWLSGISGNQLQRRWHVPHVTMFHTLGEVKNRARLGEHEPRQRIAAERSIVAEAARVICATEHERGLLRRFYEADDARMVTIPCGVDVDRFRPQDRTAARARLGLGDGPLLLYVGRIEPLKGLDIVIGALAQMDAPRPMLLVVGGDSHSAGEIRRLRAAARAAAVEECLRFVDAVPQESLPDYYAAADVCVIPSFYESFGMVALEAQSCGTPVVASRVGGLPGAIRDGETGYLVAWRCPEPFAERLDLLLRNRALRESLGSAARVWAEQFRWSAVAAQLSATYSAVLTDKGRSSGCHPDRNWAKSTHTGCDVA